MSDSDWVSSHRYQAPNTKTYGSKSRGPTNRCNVFSKTVPDDFSPPPLSSSTALTKASSLKSRSNNIPVPLLDSNEKKRKEREGGALDDKKLTKVKVDLKDLVLEGHVNDLTYLSEQLKWFGEIPPGHLGFAGFTVNIPTTWVYSEQQRLEGWLQSIGFSAKIVEHSNRVSYTCNSDKMHVLRSAVAEALVSYKQPLTRASSRSLPRSTSSESTFSEGYVRPTPLKIVPTPLVITSSFQPFTNFRDYRGGTGDFSEDSSIAGSPTPGIMSPQFSTSRKTNRSASFCCSVSEIPPVRFERAFSVDAEPLRHPIERLGEGMTSMQLGLQSQSSTSICSSISPVEAAIDENIDLDLEEAADVGSDEDSTGTIEEAIDGMEMDNSSPAKQHTTHAHENPYHARVHDEGDASIDALIASSAAELNTSLGSTVQCRLTDVSLEDIFGRPSEDRSPRVSRTRMRRSKSMPVAATNSFAADLTPARCFLTQSVQTQTPMRQEIPKIYSGRETACDWGLSQPACAEVIRLLRVKLESVIKESSAQHSVHAIYAQLGSIHSPPTSARNQTTLGRVTGSLLSPPNTLTPSDSSMRFPRNGSGNTPFLVSNFATFNNKYWSPMVNSTLGLIRSPASSKAASMETEIIYQETISNARKALLCVRSSASPDSAASRFDADTSLSLEDRRKARLKKSTAKWRRVSIALRESNTGVDTSASPTALAKQGRGAVRRLSLSTSMDITESLELEGEPDRTQVLYFDMRQRAKVDYLELNAHTFKGVCIGGTYQCCFEATHPVVAPPTSNEKRVSAVRMSDEGLELDVFIAKDGNAKVIKLGRHWCCIRACPDGFLVFKECQPARRKFVCYFLQRDPIEWIRGEPGSVTSPKKVTFFDEYQPRLYQDDDANVSHSSALHHEPMTRDEDTLTSDPSESMMDFVEENESGDEPDSDLRSVVDWNNSGIVALILEFLLGQQGCPQRGSRKRSKGISRIQFFMSHIAADVSQCRYVSKGWALGYYSILARNMSDLQGATIGDHAAWESFVKKFPSGKFLASGACKEVFCVKNSTGQLEAVSVMDVADLNERGIDVAISRELEISMLCSMLLDLNICPNFMRVRSVFQSRYGAPAEVWRRSSAPVSNFFPSMSMMHPQLPRAQDLVKGKFQYMRMEFCKGGDVEDMVRRAHQLSVDTVRCYLFQMLLALYTSREKLQLRHFDIKLLNFFATNTSSLVQGRRFGVLVGERSHGNLNVGFGEKVFCLPLRLEETDLIKLADFGTSTVGAGSLGDPIGPDQFSTLENTPIEYLLLGSEARQAYSADTFCLGLCFLHLLTGQEPYEELMKDVKCPVFFKDQLRFIWESTKSDSNPYSVINKVVESLDAEDTVNNPRDVLYDTLYRYVVLFGLPIEHFDESSDFPWSNNKVWNCMVDCLFSSQSAHTAGSRKNRQRKAHVGKESDLRLQCVGEFQRDSALWNFQAGSHDVITSARCRLREMPDGAELFSSMVSFDPSRRCTAKDALLSPVFGAFAERQPAKLKGNDLNYMHYYRSTGGASSLPML